jgi:hypothetical protein
MMVIVETSRGLFRVVDVYYPELREATGIAGDLALNQIVYVRQAPGHLPPNRLAVRYRPFETMLLDLTRDSEELFKGFSRTCRYQVRRTDRASDKIEVRRNDDAAYRDFLIIHNGLVAVKKYAEKLSEQRLNAIKPFADVLVAYFDGRPVCGHVAIRDERLGRVGLVWSASTRLKGEDSPTFVGSLNRWLHWYEMKLFKLEGMRAYDFGGVGADTPETAAIAKFKLSFGGTRILEHNYIIARAAGRAAIRFFYIIRRLRSDLWRFQLGNPLTQSPRATSCADIRSRLGEEAHWSRLGSASSASKNPQNSSL